ncbi:multinuclear nonheme iron-dependent oxidase [Aeromonas dhakensis]
MRAAARHQQRFCEQPQPRLLSRADDCRAAGPGGYFHIAGHLEEADGTLLDTHGRPVCEEVVALARYTVQTHGLRPLLLERDHHLLPLPVLEAELARVHQACCEVMAHPAGREVCHD